MSILYPPDSNHSETAGADFAADVRSVVSQFTKLCSHCRAFQRHPDSSLCAGCLEMGAADVWQQCDGAT